ncbi:MAG: hypothetical protein ABFS03_00895 [Chloroflexota bacterium]
MKIVDGLGRGYEAGVDDHGRLLGFNIVEDEDKHVNRHVGKVWSIPFTATPLGAGDYFFYFKNTGTENYFITDIRIDAAAADVIGVHKVSGTPVYVTGTDIVPVTRNTGSTLEPVATAKFDTDITGLTDDGEMFFMTCEANKLAHLRTSSNIIVTPGASIALQAATGTAALKCMVSIVGLEE